MSRRRKGWIAGLSVAVLLVVLALFYPYLVIAERGSGLDPRIPTRWQVPPSLHPELAEHSRLFERRIHQAGPGVHVFVGWGMANIITIEGDDGIIVVDTGESLAQGEAVRAELRKLTPKPVAAVVLTHHHADHVLGTAAFVRPEDAASGKVPIYAHASLLRNYLDETGLLAELQTARSAHMYGGGLGPADKDGANCGIGICIHGGTAGFIAPNRTFADRLEATVAGVRMQFLYVPSEADSEIAVYLPDRQVLLSAEVIQDHTFPNLYTIRGARYRDPVRWVHSIDLLRTLKAETMALQHGPPVLGHDEVQRVLTLYRDQIQYVHDQTVRAMNRGLSPAEIAETVRLPPHLDGEKPWGRQYYGTVSHSVRNIFGGYVGWFAGDPVELAPTPSVEAARRLVALVGGRERMLAEAERAYQAGDAQYAAELATPLVRIDQKDMQARHLKAAAFRRLGYAQMNANWRNYYLTAAMDLDDQIPEALYLKVAGRTLGSAMRSLPPAAQVELLPSRLIAEQTLNEDLVLGLHYRDAGEDFALHLRRGVLEVAPGPAAAPVFTIDATTEAMGALLAGAAPDEQINQDGLRLGGDEARARRFFTWLERPFTHKPEVVVR